MIGNEKTLQMNAIFPLLFMLFILLLPWVNKQVTKARTKREGSQDADIKAVWSPEKNNKNILIVKRKPANLEPTAKH